MTLAVSLRVPDGLVIAADSLSTTRGEIGIQGEFKGQCPACKKDIQLKDIKFPPLPIPSSVSSYAQKVFAYKEHYGIATYGMAILNEKTIYYHVKLLEQIDSSNEKAVVTKIAKKLMEYFHGEIKKQFKDIDKAPDTFKPLGFLIVGYDNEIGKTIEIHIGKKPNIEERIGSGCTIGGDIAVASNLWEIGKKDPRLSTKYASFSLQDAVDYAEYLINTTAKFQRFANMIPTVGGEVDIALITPYKKFTWIKCKKLTKILELDK
ncbi:MAG: hypothetical protein FJ126_08165 [Deltaproteobacteria bacterium]|nr:hypothetical protein [Deltaproteobacteria bacterium]